MSFSLCILDLIPKKDLEEYCHWKLEIFKEIESMKIPADYDFLVELSKTLDDISKHQIVEGKFVKYSLFDSVTGRLTLDESSFPIHNLETSKRGIIDSQNSFLLELDYNAIDLRVFLALSGVEQPKEDPHHWNVQNVFQNKVSRKEAKRIFFAWLYGSTAPDIMEFAQDLEKIYKKNVVLDKFFDAEDNVIISFFEKEILCDPYHALSYIIQSTASGLFLRALNKISKILEGKKSFVKFTIHDAIVIDFASEDGVELIKEIRSVFEKTKLGWFKSHAKIGKNYGEMELVKI